MFWLSLVQSYLGSIFEIRIISIRMYVRNTGLCFFNAYFYWLWFLPSFLLNLIFTLLWLSDAGLHFYWIWFLPYFDSLILVFILLLIFIDSYFNSLTQGLQKMLESTLKSCSKCWRFFNAHLTVLWTHQLLKGLN